MYRNIFLNPAFNNQQDNCDVEWIPYVKDENDIYALPSAETRAALNTIPTYIGPTQTRNAIHQTI